MLRPQATALIVTLSNTKWIGIFSSKMLISFWHNNLFIHWNYNGFCKNFLGSLQLKLSIPDWLTSSAKVEITRSPFEKCAYLEFAGKKQFTFETRRAPTSAGNRLDRSSRFRTRPDTSVRFDFRSSCTFVKLAVISICLRALLKNRIECCVVFSGNF